MIHKTLPHPVDDAGGGGEPHADFEATEPPPLADTVALAFGPLGIENVRASTVDTRTMQFEHCLLITEREGAVHAVPCPAADTEFPQAMATIVHLSHAPDDHVATRQLDALRWVFAWRVDEGRVAVAEVGYRTPRSEQTVAEGALVRLICNGAIADARSAAPSPVAFGHGGHGGVDATTHAAVATTPAAVMHHGGTPFAAPRVPRGPRGERTRLPDVPAPAERPDPPAATGGEGWSKRQLGLGLAGVWFSMALLFSLSHRYNGELNAETQRLQTVADTTLLQRVGETVAAGDYGEIQFELDRFARVGHFRGAVVVNARGRVVAKAGDVPEARIGDPLAASVAETGRALPLEQSPAGARVVVWDVEPQQSQDGLRGDGVLMLGLGVSVAATIATLVIARRQGRRGERGD